MTTRNPKKWFMVQLKVFCKGVVHARKFLFTFDFTLTSLLFLN